MISIDLALKIAIIVLSILLMVTILIQQQGSGLGGSFGGDGGVYRTRRGAERFLFRGTIVLAIIYVAITLATLLR